MSFWVRADRDDGQGADEGQTADAPGETQIVGADGFYPFCPYGSPALALPNVEVCEPRVAFLVGRYSFS